MKVLANIGFGSPVPPASSTLQRSMGLGSRAEIAPTADDVMAAAILQSLEDGALVLLAGGSLAGTTTAAALVAHALRVVRIAKSQKKAIALEVGNEPDLTSLKASDWAQTCRMVLSSVRAVGFTGPVYGGSVSNLNRRGLDYLSAMRWETLPSDLDCAVHRYAPSNDPARSHSVSRKAEFDEVKRIVGARASAVTEFGYHTARAGWGWFKKQLTNTQAAAALTRDLSEYQSWGAVSAAVYQWSDGPGSTIADRWGLVDVAGSPKPQGRAVAAWVASQAPVVPPVTPPGDIRIHCTTTGTVTAPATLTIDNGHTYTAVMDAAVSFRYTFTMPGTEPPWGYRYDWPGKTQRSATPLPGPGDHEGIVLAYAPPVVTLSRLDPVGQFYYRQGSPFTVIECSDFQLFERYLRGQDIRPVLEDRRDLGFNTLRVWLLNTSVCHILPSEWPDFYQKLGPFLDALAGYGLYAELTVFTQAETLMPQPADQQAHYDATVQAIGGRYAFVEGVNEADSHDNAFDPALRLWRPEGAIFDLCRGSNGADAESPEPIIDSTRYHSNDTNEWWRRCAHNGMEQGDKYSRPNIANENTRPDHDPDTRHHHDAAAGAALLSAGSCFHSQGGKSSVAFTGIDRQCAAAWVQGARSVDLSQRVYGYIHRTDLEGPDVIRAYQRGSCVVLIHA